MHNKRSTIIKTFILIIIFMLSVSSTGLVFAQTIDKSDLPSTTELTSQNIVSTFSLVSGSGTYGGMATLTATLKSETTPLVAKKVVFRLNGRKFGFASTDANGVATCTGRLQGIKAGTFADAVGVSFAGDADYAKSTGLGTLIVAKKDIIVTAVNKSSVVGSEIPRLTYRTDGQVSREATKVITIATTATETSPAGTYPITVSGPAFTDNYNISYVTGVLTISADPLVASEIQLTGPDSITIPTGFSDYYHKSNDDRHGVLKKTGYKAKVLDQYGNPFAGVKVTWSLLAPVTGVRISPKNGTVTITPDVIPGSITVVATAGSLTGSKTVTLVAASPVPVTSVGFKKPAVTVYVGKTMFLHANVLPFNATNKAVTWASGNPSVATVDANGKITGISAGSAVITVNCRWRQNSYLPSHRQITGARCRSFPG
jgi:hypothetical protein